MPFIDNLAYEASAGSGKTFMLVVRYLSLLFKGADSSKILALTFTNKAASEMNERIIETLEELESRMELDEIAKECGVAKHEILVRRSKILAEFLNAHTKIMTIDSFFTQILRKFSLYASLMPDFSTANAQHEVKLVSRFLKEVSVANKRSTLINLSLESNKRVSDIFALLDTFYLKKEELAHLKFDKSTTKKFEEEAMEGLRALQSSIANCKEASSTLKKAVVVQSFDELKAKTWVYKESLNYWVFKKCFTPDMDAQLQKIQNALKAHAKAKEQNFFYALNELVGVYKKAKKALYIDESELSFSDVTLLVYEILVDVVKKCIDEYKLFHDDFHLIRFMSAVSTYADIEALLFEYERLDTSAAAADISGVRVLTVHKSKGLEYEHVIVIDRLKRAPASRDAIIYNYDGIKLQNLFLRTKNRELIDNDYAYALAKEKELTREDTLNALYVAFTRARENLLIIQKSENSTFELLDLQTKSFGKLQSTCKGKKSVQVKKKLAYENLYYGTQSDLLALESEGEEDIKAINFGIALHYTLEMMYEFTFQALQDAKNMMLNKYGFMLDEAEIADIEQRIRHVVDSQEFLNLTDGVCYREKALRYKNNLRYLDLLVQKTDGSYNVVDYKSSMKYSEHHLKQVRYYIKAVQEITGNAVSGYICYILEDDLKVIKV